MQVRPGTKSKEPARGKKLTEGQFLDRLNKVSASAHDLALWVLVHAKEHHLYLEWGIAGPSLKYRNEHTNEEFNFGQLSKYGELRTSRLLPRFVKLGLPTAIALEYLDDLVKLVPGSMRKEYGYENELKTQTVVFGPDNDWLPLAPLATQKDRWFEAIDRAIERIKAIQAEQQTSTDS